MGFPVDVLSSFYVDVEYWEGRMLWPVEDFMTWQKELAAEAESR